MAATQAPGRWRYSTLWLTLAVLAIVGTAAVWPLVTTRGPGRGPIRIGYRNQPPLYFAEPERPRDGLAVSVIGEAARRLGIEVRWTLIENREGSSLTALRNGRIDLWPTAQVPSAAPGVSVTDAWLESTFYLVHRRGTIAGEAVGGKRIAISASQATTALAQQLLSDADLRTHATPSEAFESTCLGRADAAFIEGRQLQSLLLDRPTSCIAVPLEFRPKSGAVLSYGVGSTPASAGYARALRNEIERMAEDGTLSTIHARWSFAADNETRAVYASQRERQRMRWTLLGFGALTVALVVSLWQIKRSAAARRLAEHASKQAEAASRTAEGYARQQERYRLLFERNMAGVLRTTIDGTFLDCNPAFLQILGYGSIEELRQFTAPELYEHPKDRAKLIERLAVDGHVTSLEIRLRRKDGTLASLLENVTMVDQGPDLPVILESTATDITDQRRLEEQYRQAQKMESVGRLAGGVAHDFNNLLTAIIGYTELVLAELVPDSGLRPPLEEIAKASRRAASLTQQLLAFSRKQFLRPRIVNVNAEIEGTELLIRQAVGEDVELVTRLDPALRDVRADPSQLHQVILNLAINARDAMPDGGRLVLETENVDIPADAVRADPDTVTGPCVHLRMTDTGRGMDPETRRRIFEPFFTTKERGKGTGLGLSTVYGIIKQSGGHVTVQSETGVGTVFDIYLPVGQRPTVAKEPADPRGRTTSPADHAVVSSSMERDRRAS